ncbi:MAG: ASKHA domain-containing protein [Desulfocucumaceae bacterium]
MAGANLIYGAGMLELGITFDYAIMVMENEMAAMIKKAVQRISVSGETLALTILTFFIRGAFFMAKITILPDNRSFPARAGECLYDVLLAGGVEISAICGGKGTCGKCQVVVAEGKVKGEALNGQTYLACKTHIDGDVAVRIIQSADSGHRKSNLYKKLPVLINPGTRKFFVNVPGPSLQDQRPDWERMVSLLPGGIRYQPTVGVLARMPELLREADYEVTAVISNETVLAVEKGDTTSEIYGAAFDIGTTTVVAYLANLTSGDILATCSVGNPQRIVGADVISRIEYISKTPTGGKILKEKIMSALNQLVDQLLDDSGIDRQLLYEAAIVGNTTMQHLLLGINPCNLARAPYTPVIKSSISVPADKIGLGLADGGSVYILPNIAGFVGSDTVGVILSMGMGRQSGTRLAIDIGTNGEVALGSGEHLLVCSTAAGPAFEGARISCGMRAADGAIEGVRIDDLGVKCEIIGNTVPVLGICGSGLIQCAAEMLRLGILDSTGRLLGPEDALAKLSPAIAGRVAILEGQAVFLLVPEDANSGQWAIYISQKDIRELQLAKGAIAAGIRILMKEMNIALSDIKEVLLAGAFGSYIDIASARLLGLLPQVPLERIKSVGNAAGMGALQALLSLDAREEAQNIAACAKNIELSVRADFQAAFVDALSFYEFNDV